MTITTIPDAQRPDTRYLRVQQGEAGVVLEARKPGSAIITILTEAETRNLIAALQERLPKPPKPLKVGPQISALAVGDNFTVVYDTGVEHKGIKVDAEKWFSYSDKLIRRIMTDGGQIAGVVTNS